MTEETEKYRTKEVAELAGVHRDTLLRWLREGRIPEPSRDRNNWRWFSKKDLANVLRYTHEVSDDVLNENSHESLIIDKHQQAPFAGRIKKLIEIDWDFSDANTSYLTHSIHPYPAKFIPQIPNYLIQELSSIGDTVLDPFCGSGTTLVEAQRLGRNGIGIDANPLACLISRAKTALISTSETDELTELIEITKEKGDNLSIQTLPLFENLSASSWDELKRPTGKGITEWFYDFVIDELVVLRNLCRSLKSENARNIALTAFSSIIVGVSLQDSETRYARREKLISPGETFKRFSTSLKNALEMSLDLQGEVSRNTTINIIEANILHPPIIPIVDLIVCSPPYPNAFSYHLYHRTRMNWLEMDQPKFKQEEIGSHRKYSRKGPNGATKETFRRELKTILSWIKQRLAINRHACFVIGSSVIKGQYVENDKILIDEARKAGFLNEATINRNLKSTAKYFNPSIGRIRDEKIVILRNLPGEIPSE